MTSEDPPKNKPRLKNRNFLLRHLPLEHETALYLLVSAFDVFMTYLLLRTDRAVEANPIARFFLNHWGIRGMIYFKFSLVAFVCVVTQIIANRKETTARRILYLAIAVVSVVVIYSLVLYVRILRG